MDKVPARLLAFDLLEWQGRDVRALPLQERRALLETLPLHQSERLHPADWQAARQLRLGAREFLAEGLMLKRMDSEYGVGREKGRWWKWKVDPYSVDAVLIYAQRGHGRRASLYTDYTFGVWDKDKLAPFAKAYSGLTDAEIREVDSFIRSHTMEKFGPVCTVTPQLVFEIAFEGVEKEDFTADLSLIVAAQKVEHYEISGYTSVRNLAHQLGEAAVVKLLEETLGEEQAADSMLGELSMPLMQNATVRAKTQTA